MKGFCAVFIFDFLIKLLSTLPGCAEYDRMRPAEKRSALAHLLYRRSPFIFSGGKEVMFLLMQK